MLSPAKAPIQTFWVSARLTAALSWAASAIVCFDFGGARGRERPPPVCTPSIIIMQECVT